MQAILSRSSKKLLTATALAGILALSGCAKPKQSPHLFSETDPGAGLPESEPGPDEVARVSAKENGHPTFSFAGDGPDASKTTPSSQDSKTETNVSNGSQPIDFGKKAETGEDLFHPLQARAAQDHTYVRKPPILLDGRFPAKKKASQGSKVTEDKTEGKGPDLSFCHSAKWSTACLTGLLVYRCSQYTFPLTPYGCAAAATSFIDRLEMKRIDVTLDGTTYNLPVIFTKKLVTMMEDPAIRKDILDLYELIKASAPEKKKVDLWQWWLNASGGNADLALDRISVLLQDTSPVQIQTEYLLILKRQGKLSPAAGAAIDDLLALNDILTNESLAELDYRSWLTLYPTATKGLEEDATPLVYHYYPMAMLARDLKRSFGARLGSFLPFLFNTEYLNQTLDPSRWPFHHPRSSSIDLKDPRIQWKMRDMYAGFAASLWGVGKPAEAKGLTLFQESYAKSPFKQMRHLFLSMP